MMPADLPVRDLRPLLEADSLVIVGASADFSRLGGMPVRSLIDGGFPRDRLLLVNPKYDRIADLPCFASVDALPWTPMLAVLAVRAADTLATLERCHARGIRAAVIFASGFAEEGAGEGAAMQRVLVDFASRTGMLIAGPNCIGFANFHRRLFATFLKNIEHRSEPGSLAVLAQSGNMAGLLRNIGLDAGFRCAHVVSTGNEACVDFVEYLDYLRADARCRAVLAYVEQIRRGPAFLQAACAMRKAGKPLFILKAGTSAKGAEAAASHTAAIAGSDTAFNAACRQAGILTATDPHRLLDLVRLWHTGKAPANPGVCVVSLSGAGCALVADHLAREHVEVPTLSAATQQRLRSVVPSFGMVSNPVDLTGSVTNDRSSFSVVLAAVAEAPEFGVLVFYVMGAMLDGMAPELERISRATRKLLVVIDTAAGATSHAALEAAGVVVFTDMNRACAALAGFLRWNAERGELWRPAPVAVRESEPEDLLVELVQRARRERRTLLTEVEAKALLAHAGLPMVPEAAASDGDQAVRAAQALGWPVAIKVLSPDIAHKTEVGGVVLGLRQPEDVREATARVLASARRACPEARLDGVVVQRMVEGGVPILLGVVRDTGFGPLMTVGFGGTQAELDPDVAHRLLPLDAAGARQMLGELRKAALLHGWRGAPRADSEALVALMVRLSDFVLAQGATLAELELNPVLVQQHGAIAVDALVRIDNGIEGR